MTVSKFFKNQQIAILKCGGYADNDSERKGYL